WVSRKARKDPQSSQGAYKRIVSWAIRFRGPHKRLLIAVAEIAPSPHSLQGVMPAPRHLLAFPVPVAFFEPSSLTISNSFGVTGWTDNRLPRCSKTIFVNPFCSRSSDRDT